MTSDYQAIADKLDADIASAAAAGHFKVECAWTIPREMRTDLPPAPPLEMSALMPKVLGDFVLDEADRMPCPPDYIAAAVMVFLGSLIGASCGIKPKTRDDWLVVPNLYGAVVGDPSAKKSPALGVVTRIFDRLEKIEAQKHSQAMAAYDAEVMAYEARQAALKLEMRNAATATDGTARMAAAVDAMKSMVAPSKPLMRRFRTNDGTIEKIGDLLTTNPNGLLVYRDELMGLLSSWEKDGHEGDRTFYLEAWNGTGSYCVDRIGRGSTTIENHCLSVFGGIQPDLLERYLAEIVAKMDNDGRLQRFQMLTFPESVAWEWRDRVPMAGAREDVQTIFENLAVFDPLAVGASPADAFSKVPYFRFSDKAQALFIDWCTELHTVLIPFEQDPMLKQHLGKYEKLFCSIALILHLVEGGGERISMTNACRAAAWCDYLRGHARRVYALVEASKVTSATLLAKRVAAGKLADGFTARDVMRKQWSRLTTSTEVERALAILEEHGWLQSVDADNSVVGGRPTVRYAINPRIKDGVYE